ncbi:MAG: D-sedoheptulose 7-phosphate isomerase [Armatimonadota bacterium]|nr:D-sedoheptulose 7-phosphate isomerase [Armatimonadota bacterium]
MDTNTETLIVKALTESAQLKLQVAKELRNEIAAAAKLIGDVFLAGGKLLLCGNGGSAADAQHIAGEFVGRFRIERAALPAIALNVNTSVLTAIGNDYGFEKVFARQVEAMAVAGDALFGISTSGQSENVALAMDVARSKGCKTIALIGGVLGRVGEKADIAIAIPSRDTPRIQESHIAVAHVICDLVEQRVAAELSKES